MRTLIWTLVLILSLLGGAYMYSISAAVLDVEILAAETIPASEKLDVFNQIKGQISAGGTGVREYAQADLSDPEEFVLLKYTIRLANNGFLAAEWLEFYTMPTDYDIAQVVDIYPPKLNGMSQGKMVVWMLCKAGAPQQRLLRASYYVFGQRLGQDAAVMINQPS